MDQTHRHHPQTGCPPCYVFEVVRIALIGEDLLQGVRFTAIPIPIDAAARIGRLPHPPTPPHQICLFQPLPHICYDLNNKLDFDADILPLSPLLLLLLLLLLLIRKLGVGRWGGGGCFRYSPLQCTIPGTIAPPPMAAASLSYPLPILAEEEKDYADMWSTSIRHRDNMENAILVYSAPKATPASFPS